MTFFLKIFSFVGLGLTLVPSFLVFQGFIEPGLSKTLMLVGTIIWFATAPQWLNKFQEEPKDE
ncbi:hypothetical protein [Anditalea andensis]|uniref:Uncharacterized protein n=1 Tax=Anditalea andensis TaxID=1048983 RepID=A0A074L3F7_9BACT|nr:hypothetical protein [Anditalea andensis]KEO75699.1 hypothetical protein EL17_21965 [Anditalea andensis]